MPGSLQSIYRLVKAMFTLNTLQFYDSWKALCDWLEDGEERLQKFIVCTGVRLKQDVIELRVSLGVL